MMDLEQRMEEIYIRSQAIYCKRRRRNRVLLSCVPLVLCVAVLAGGYLQDRDVTQQEGYAEAVVEVVQGCMGYEIKDPERVAQIVELLYACMGDQLPEDFVYGDAMGKPETDSGEDMDSVEGITGDGILVTLSDGTTHCYRLVGNQLTDWDTEKTVILSDEKAAQLNELLADRGE